MIRVESQKKAHKVTFSVRPPTVYLDHWALREFSTNQTYQNRFLSYFEERGTLLFSYANVIEIIPNSGPSADSIRDFLTKIGDAWFPLEFNPWKVMEKERGFKPGDMNPCFSYGFAKGYMPYAIHSDLSLSKIVDLTRASPESKNTIDNLIAETKELIETRRRVSRSGTLKPIRQSRVRFNPRRPTEFVYYRLQDILAKENLNIADNDALDYWHTIVTLVYCDFLLLDRKWADLAGKVKIPRDQVRIYTPRQVGEFLDDLER